MNKQTKTNERMRCKRRRLRTKPRYGACAIFSGEHGGKNKVRERRFNQEEKKATEEHVPKQQANVILTEQGS